jgi:uncharacterized protein YdaU (DUF1376 family)
MQSVPRLPCLARFLISVKKRIKEDMKTVYETEAQHRARAVEALRKAKEKEATKGVIPIRLADADKTIVMVSNKLSKREREDLRRTKTELYAQRKRVTIEEPLTE